MNFAYAALALLASGFSAYSFFKAGRFKASASHETLLGAGFGWVEKTPFGIVRVIAWLEILGAIGVVLAPLAAWIVPGFEWAKWFGVAAGAGLALTMVGAALVHIARKEIAYTWRANLSLFLAAFVAAVLQLLVEVPLF